MTLLLWVDAIVLALSAVGVGLIFAGYPGVLWLLSRWRPIAHPVSPPRDDAEWPSVSVLVVVRNAAALIRDKLENCLSLDYPPGRLDVVFYLDGCTDGTESVLAACEDPRVTYRAAPEHEGKIAGLNAAVPLCRGSIVVFSDADALLEPDAVRRLIVHFSDPAVGGVCGRRVIRRENAALADAQGRYVSMDSAVKVLESRVGSLTSNDGKLYAIRRELYRPIPEAVTDDLYVCLTVVEQGRRFIFEEAARAAISVPSRSPAHELVRRTRIVSTSLRGIAAKRVLLNPFRFGFYSVGFLVNRTLRRFLPVMLLGLLAGAAMLALMYPVWGGALLAPQLLFYGLAALHPIAERARRCPRRLRRFASLAFYFCVGNYGTLLGVIAFLRGREIRKWTPVKTD